MSMGISRLKTWRRDQGTPKALVIALSALLACCAGENSIPDDPDPEPTPTNWIWISGSDDVNQIGNYGTLGVTAPSNVPGGRSMAASWMDSSGKLWLFGGYAYTSAGSTFPEFLNDLWRYDPDNFMWTWVSGSNLGNQDGIFGTKGVPDPSNAPGGRAGAASWVDSHDNLWLFGGFGYMGQDFSDLWKYDPGSNQWTWVSGPYLPNRDGVYGTKGVGDPSNFPGARSPAASWRDANDNLWLFGGFSRWGEVNDLWKYDPVADEWTWISGSDTASQPGVYGTKGVGDPANVPGARNASVSWADDDGNFWLFGGMYYFYLTEPGERSYLNDLWKYDPASNEWTWVSGSSLVNQDGVYGTKGTPGSLNIPGARDGASSWTDPAGGLWLFGGNYAKAHRGEAYNDLWRYVPVANEWTWMAGSNLAGMYGIYGTKYVAGSNLPGARAFALSWTAPDGKFWLFGGGGRTGDAEGALNDLWQYVR